MNYIEFNDVTFTYPSDEDGENYEPVFEHFTGRIPFGFTSIIGPNGSGKSTFMLLASGRICPQNGHVYVAGQELCRLPEEKRNLVASMIYQNMEFEDTDTTIMELLQTVFENGIYKGKAQGVVSGKNLLEEVIEIFKLNALLTRSLTAISKSELQRVLLAFSILYGSCTVFMDEPMFAMEDSYKNEALEYLKTYSKKTETAFFISMHELELTKKYADNVLLIRPDRSMAFGTVDEIMTNEELESAYGIPAAMLHDQESLSREQLQQESEALRQNLK